ncbi:MAG: hypothetical protein ACUVTL_03865 [Thermoproteota archaeon]
MVEEMLDEFVLGSLIDPSSGKEIGIAKLTRAELSEGIGVFGSGYEDGTMVLVEGANSLGFKVLIIDPFGKFWPLLDAKSNSKVIMLGDYGINPLKSEGRDWEAYVDLLSEALSFSFGTSLQAISDLKNMMIEMLRRSESELTLMDLASLFEAQSEINSHLTAYGVLQPLLTGRSAEPFKGRQSIHMSDLLKDISVVDLSYIQSRCLKILAYALIIVKLIDHARQNKDRILLTIDSPEIMWPDLDLQRIESRSAFFYVHSLQMLRHAGVHLCLCSISPVWIERRILSNIGTLLHFRALNPYSAIAASNMMGKKIDPNDVRTLRTSFAYILRSRCREAELLRINRPRWLYAEVSRERLVERNTQLGLPPQIQNFGRMCRIFEDFPENSKTVLEILRRVKISGGIPLQDYENDIELRNKRILSKLLGLQYLKVVNTEFDGTRHALLALTEKGIRTLKEFEKEKGGDRLR